MSWVRLIAAAGLVLSPMALPALAGAATVVASRGPSAAKYPVGAKLGAGVSLSLAAGDSVTLLDDKGTRVLTGPGTFAAAQASDTSRQSVFTALVRDRTSVRVRTGSVRNGPNGEPPRSPNMWYVDASRPGTYCLTDANNVRLWRPMPGKTASVTVTGPAGSSETVSFGAQDLVAPWDVSKVPVVAEKPYALKGSEAGLGGEVSFRFLGEDPESMEGLAAALIEKGCMIQLDLLATTVQLPPES